MKLKLFICTLMLGALTASAQKIKVKKGLVTVDNIEYAKFEKEYGNKIIKTLDGTKIAVVKEYSFEKPNPIKRNPNSKAPYKATVTERYSVVKFLKFDLEFETKLTTKKLMKAFYNNQVIGEGNVVSEEKANELAELISKDISGTRPYILVR